MICVRVRVGGVRARCVGDVERGWLNFFQDKRER